MIVLLPPAPQGRGRGRGRGRRSSQREAGGTNLGHATRGEDLMHRRRGAVAPGGRLRVRAPHCARAGGAGGGCWGAIAGVYQKETTVCALEKHLESTPRVQRTTALSTCDQRGRTSGPQGPPGGGAGGRSSARHRKQAPRAASDRVRQLFSPSPVSCFRRASG